MYDGMRIRVGDPRIQKGETRGDRSVGLVFFFLDDEDTVGKKKKEKNTHPLSCEIDTTAKNAISYYYHFFFLFVRKSALF